MSLESSNEHAEQEPPRPATSEEEQPSSNLPAEQETSIGHQKHALERAATLNNAAIAARNQYRTSGQMADLNRAVRSWVESMQGTPPNSSPVHCPG